MRVPVLDYLHLGDRNPAWTLITRPLPKFSQLSPMILSVSGSSPIS